MWHNNVSELFVYRNIMNNFVQKFHKPNDVIKNDNINKRQKIFDDLLKKHKNKLFTDTNIINISNLTQKEMKIFIESKNREYSKEKRDIKYNELAKNIIIQKSNIDSYCKSFHVDTIIIQNALNLYDRFTTMVNKQEIINKMNLFSNSYSFNSMSKDENIIRVFLENYSLKISYYKNNNLINILSNNIVSKKSNLSLVNLFDGYFFYLIDNGEEPLGLTNVSRDTVRSIINFNTVESNIEYFDPSITRYSKPEIITSKDKIANDGNSMNNTILSDLKFLKIRKYKFH